MLTIRRAVTRTRADHDGRPGRQARGSTTRLARTGAAAVALSAAFTFTLGTPAAHAHSSLVSSTPEDGATVQEQPGTVELVFNERIQDQPDFTQMAVLDAEENAFHTGDPVVDENRVRQDVSELPDGDYSMSYRIVSADGHPVSGTIEFTMSTGLSGDADNQPAPDPDATQQAQPDTATATATEPAAEQATDDASSDGGVDSSMAIGGGIIVAILAGLTLVTMRSRRRLQESASEYGPESDRRRDG